MKIIRYPFIHQSRRVLIIALLLFEGIVPEQRHPLYATEPTSAVTAQTALRIGDNYGGGKVVWIFQPGEQGYVEGQTHGLVAATEDIGNGTTWTTAVKLCREYRGGGFSDWRLPDKNELNRLFMSKSTTGGFRERQYYWSSSESDKNDAWDQSFRTGITNLGYKLDNNYARPVRSF
jgi:hypothetical protein